jgi:hypothetical protein
MFLDLSEELTKWQLANVMHQAAFRGWFDKTKVQRQIERGIGRRGSTRLHEALALYLGGSAGTRSALEDFVLEQFLNLGAPEPLVCSRVATFGDELEVDLCWPDHGLIVEVDGPGHSRPTTAAEDRRRDACLRAAGYRVVRIRAPNLSGQIAAICGEFDLVSGRSRPQISSKG